MCMDCAGGNEYGQCGEEPERKEDGTRALRRDIPTPQRCAPKLKVRQVSGIGFVRCASSVGMFLDFFFPILVQCVGWKESN
jgi:hypothetical protein